MKENVQRFGRFLSGMVMPNIAAFIAWGFLTALFIETGWIPNENFATIVGPMLSYALPLLIGYTGGKMVYGTRGGVVGATATMGVIVGADIPMFLGAMIMGPLGGWFIKKFDNLVEGKVKAGFEMLVNNFSAGIIGLILMLIAFTFIGPVATGITSALGSGVGYLVDHNLLPLTSIIVEPAKVLFLNNAINHGVFTPLGTQQALDTGKSIFFLIEANPGPGLGLLLAYTMVGKGIAKSSAPGAIIIHFFGGIHEIYFPYVLMNPLTILAVMAGGATGVFTNVLFQSGLKAPASPGSIIAVLLMTDKSSYLGVILSVILSATVSFLIASLILKTTGADADDSALEEASAKVSEMKSESKGVATNKVNNNLKVVFACDAGMGSSAMGATTLTRKLKAAGYDIKVEHYSIDEIPADVDVIAVQQSLVERVESLGTHAKIFPITNFMGGSEYDNIIKEIEKM